MRFGSMTDTIEYLRRKMEAAAAVLDFDEAKRCRDMITAMRGGATLAEAEAADFSDLQRQQPGQMGLGTNQQRNAPPRGWRAPRKPDPMTTGRSTRRKRPAP